MEKRKGQEAGGTCVRPLANPPRLQQRITKMLELEAVFQISS
jgi:hypothetical protein